MTHARVRPISSARPIRSLALASCAGLACALAMPLIVAPASFGQSMDAGQTGRVGRASEWDLDFRPGPLRAIVDPEDAQAYWYFTYKVINQSGRERMWAPRFELFTDRGALHTSGREIPTRVTQSVLDLLGNPLLVDQNQIIGEILVGEEHAKEGLVIFPADRIVTELTVFVTGASGRVRKVPHPKGGEPIAERWTIRFNYQVSGDALARGSRPVEPAAADEDVEAGAQRRTDWGVWLWR